jgi:peptide/nickel transport system ATP-binding protein
LSKEHCVVAKSGQGKPLIDVHDLTVDYWNRRRWVNVVNRVHFEVEPGEALGLVGESGCGKSTTAYALLGYYRQGSRIREGGIQFGDQDILRLSPRQLSRLRGKRISLVPQNPTTTLSPGMVVGNQILEVLNRHGIGDAGHARRDRVYDLFEQVRLPEPERIAKRYPHQLSGGQQQRVAIAMALACNPELVVLDEPTTGLDVTTQAQILDLLVRLRAEHAMSMVYVTHDLGVISLICDRVAVMYAGELVEDAYTRELFDNPRHPYTRGLIASIASVRAPLRARALLKGYLQPDQLPAGCRFAPRCDFALPRCFEEPQPLQTVADDHRAACWRWPDVPALAAEQTATADRPAALLAKGKDLLVVGSLDCAYGAGSGVHTVVKGVSFTIQPSETFALVGESGSGKSTIARAVAGLLSPAAGLIQFEDKTLPGKVAARAREQLRQIQLVLQNPDASLNPRQRVLNIVARPLEHFFGLRRTALRERVEQFLHDVRLDTSYLDRFPDQLSGGERQRVAIARALAADPKLMLCDEILSALDVSVQSSILELMRALQNEHQIAYLFISHDLAVVRSLAHRVGVLYRGEMCEVGLVEEVYSPPYHPYTHMLLSAVPEIGKEAETLAQPTHSTAEPNAPQRETACPFADRCPWKLGSICDEVVPPWRSTSDTHALRCHIPLDELRARETWSKSGLPKPETA